MSVTFTFQDLADSENIWISGHRKPKRGSTALIQKWGSTVRFALYANVAVGPYYDKSERVIWNTKTQLLCESEIYEVELLYFLLLSLQICQKLLFNVKHSCQVRQLIYVLPNLLASNLKSARICFLTEKWGSVSIITRYKVSFRRVSRERENIQGSKKYLQEKFKISDLSLTLPNKRLRFSGNRLI